MHVIQEHVHRKQCQTWTTNLVYMIKMGQTDVQRLYLLTGKTLDRQCMIASQHQLLPKQHLHASQDNACCSFSCMTYVQAKNSRTLQWYQSRKYLMQLIVHDKEASTKRPGTAMMQVATGPAAAAHA